MIDLQQIQAALSARFVGRKHVVRALLAALLAGQHAYLVGPPGTGKTALLEALVGQVKGAKLFTASLHGQENVAALLGPVDIPAFEREGVWRRRSKGFLPDAHLALLDELDTARPDLTDALLKILADGRWHDGERLRASELLSVVGAGNGIPASDRLWDRFLVRLRVDYVNSDEEVRRLLNPEPATGSSIVPLSALRRARTYIPTIPLTEAAIGGIVTLRRRLYDRGIRVSDRRLVAAQNLARATAHTLGRRAVQLADLDCLADALWLRMDQADEVGELVCAVAQSGGSDAVDRIADRLRAVEVRIEKVSSWGSAARPAGFAGVLGELELVRADLEGLGWDAGPQVWAHWEGLHGLVAAEAGAPAV